MSAAASSAAAAAASASPVDAPSPQPTHEQKSAVTIDTNKQDAPSSPPASTPAPDSLPTLSLFAQLQAAQATKGTEAAAALLRAKAEELLGMSQGEGDDKEGATSSDLPPSTSISSDLSDLVPSLDEATKARLIREGEELRGFAELLLRSDEGEAVSGVWQTLAESYNSSGSGLQNEAVNLFTHLHASEEAQQLTAVSQELIDQWKVYLSTDEGQRRVNESGEVLLAQTSGWGNLLQELTSSASELLGVPPSTSPRGSISSRSRSASSRSTGGGGAGGLDDPSSSPPSASALGGEPLLQKEMLLKRTKKVTNVLSTDEDVKTLLSKSSGLLKSFNAGASSGDEASRSGRATPSQSISSRSSRADKKGETDDPTAAVASPTGGPADADDGQEDGVDLASATEAGLKAGESYLKNLRESKAGNKLLSKGLTLLQENKDLLAPEALTSFSSSLLTDDRARQQFLDRVKDNSLEFLLSYLPTVEVPPVTGEKERVAYEVANIDLGGFKVDTNKVWVTLEGTTLKIKAKGIGCKMQNLKWKYQKLSFPRLSGEGTADAVATDVEFHLYLKLDYASEADKQHAEAKVAEAAAVAAQAETKKNKSSQNHTPSHSPSKHTSSAAATATAAHVNSTASPAASPASVPSSSPPPSSSLSSSLLSTLSTDLGQPKLSITRCQVRLQHLTISIHSGFLKSVYNFLLGLFSEPVRKYLEETLNSELASKSAYLLDTINELSRDYLPLLQRILIKATTAALEEEQEEEGQQQGVQDKGKEEQGNKEEHSTTKDTEAKTTTKGAEENATTAERKIESKSS